MSELILPCSVPNDAFRVQDLTDDGFLVGIDIGELLSDLVFEACRSCGDLAVFCGFNSVFERNACDDFGEAVKAA